LGLRIKDCINQESGGIYKKVGMFIFVFLVDLVCFVPLVRLRMGQSFKGRDQKPKGGKSGGTEKTN